MNSLRIVSNVFIVSTVIGMPVHGDEIDLIREALVFHAPFDGSADARIGVDKQIFTAESANRNTVRAGNHTSHVVMAEGAGRFGDALRYRGEGKDILMFDGRNAGYRKSSWSGTVSFWLKLDPDRDLAPGFCDPIQLTDKAWNNAAMWVDFDRELPRTFRLGMFSNYSVWNPNDTPWDDFPVSQRPMIPVNKPPFASDRWTHVVFVFDNINPADDEQSLAVLYLDGVPQGVLSRPLKMDWDVERAVIMLGISYTGDLDDLAIFNRAFTAEQVKQLHALPEGVSGL